MTKMWGLIRLMVVVALVLSLGMVLVPQAQASPAGIVNGGFETGDLSGWSVSLPPGGYAAAVTSYAGFTPKEGSYFAGLKTNGPSSYTTLSQTFSAGVGETVKGWAFFNAADYMPYNDNAQVRIKQGATVLATVFSASVSTVGDYGQTPWTYWQYTFASAGTYTVEARITNALDSVEDSQMGLDGAVQVVPAVGGGGLSSE